MRLATPLGGKKKERESERERRKRKEKKINAFGIGQLVGFETLPSRTFILITS